MSNSRDIDLEGIRQLARMIADNLEESPGGDIYTYKGSTNDVDDLKAALSNFDHEHRGSIETTDFDWENAFDELGGNSVRREFEETSSSTFEVVDE